MIRQIDFRHEPADGPASDDVAVLPRAAFDVAHAVEIIKPICEDVRMRGEVAVLDAGERLDGVRPPTLAVPTEARTRALAELDPRIRAGLVESIRRLRETCEVELERSTEVAVAPGAVVERRIVPMERVGLYVPGGLAPLLSTVIMNAVPAQVAGVGSIALASPPQAEFGGLPHPSILAACELLGIEEVYAAGGAQALAMFAYGAGSCRAVNLITGPGNIYVAAAKRHLQGTVSIDSEAGPTEIAIIADSTADPEFVAADLISQSEHDPLAASILITDSEELATAVQGALVDQVPSAKHHDRIEQSLDGEQSAIVLVRDIDQAVAVANYYAAEHLEIQTEDAAGVSRRIVNSGAIFVGAFTPVSVGDYCAGSNHVLPTAGSAKHSSGLSVRAFVKNVHVVTYDEQALRDVSGRVVDLAAAENLPSHGAAVSIRTQRPAADGDEPR